MKRLQIIGMMVMMALCICLPLQVHADECLVHAWSFERDVQIDENTHASKYVCDLCGEVKYEDQESHDWYCDDYYEKVDDYYHNVSYTCQWCDATKTVKEVHMWTETDDPVKIDGTYHGYICECDECGATKIDGKEKHDWYASTTLPALSTGNVTYKCYCNGCEVTKKVKQTWKLGTSWSRSYDLYPAVICNGAGIYKVTAKNTIKGSVIKLSIGKKTYTKKITKTKNGSTTFKIKVKKVKYGQKITVNVYYKGKVIGKNAKAALNDGGYKKVLYAKNPKKGMKQKYVPYTLWGKPVKKVKKSNNVTIWYNSDWDFIKFKNGKVYY